MQFPISAIDSCSTMKTDDRHRVELSKRQLRCFGQTMRDQSMVPRGTIMPFSKYTVDHEEIEAMRAAFHRVCDVLQLSGGTDDVMTELVVMKIVELAKGGELNPERLCNTVLADLGA
jgi:hypothetical protein